MTTDRFGNAPPRPPGALVEPVQGGGFDLATGVAKSPRDQVPRYAEVFPFDYVYDPERYIW